MEELHHPLRRVLDVRGPGLEILVVHLGEHFRKIVPSDGHRVLGVHLLGLHHIADGVIEVLVVQHHGLDIENPGV